MHRQRLTRGAVSQIIPAARPKRGRAGYPEHNHAQDDGLTSAIRAAQRAEKDGATWYDYKGYRVVLCKDGIWREWGAARPSMVGKAKQCQR